MKYLTLLALSFVLSLHTEAQSKAQAGVQAAIDQLKAAMISGEKKALEEIAADSLSYGHSGGNVQNKAEFVEAIASGKSDFVTIDLTDQTISVVGNTAIVRHTLSATTNDGGKPGSVKLKILLIFTKDKGRWTLLARQAVKMQV